MINPIIWLISLSVVCIVIPLFLQKYKSRRWFQGILIGELFFLIGLWFSYGLIEYSKFQDSELKISLEPKIDISFNELTNHQLEITLKSLNKNSSKIDELYFRFDIPGVFINISNEYNYHLNGCKFFHSEKTGGWNGSSTNAIYSEYISLYCDSILSDGYYNAIINYNPTKEIDFGIENYSYIRMPFMGINDFPSYVLSWTFNGNSNQLKNCINLTNLDYIKKDDNNSVYDPICYDIPELCDNPASRAFCTNNITCEVEKEYQQNGCEA